MKTKLFVLFSIAITCVNAQDMPATKTETLDNKTVISLTKIGLPPTTIISKIKTSAANFDVSIDALINLQSNNVNGEVINEMIKRDELAKKEALKTMNSSNPNEMHAPGIYYYNPNNKEKPVIKVDAAVIGSNQVKSSNAGAFVPYGGFIPSTSEGKSSLSNAHAHLEISEPNPVFYFYFEHNDLPDANGWWFATATSPNEFVLVELYDDKNNGNRYFKTGSSKSGIGGESSSSGIPEKDKVSFDYTQVSEGIYKVTFSKPLAKSDYCFVYGSSAPKTYNNNKVFDFYISFADYKK